MSVLLFHAGVSFFCGGFVGVDVFFVISGYLITTIILNGLHDGTFSLINFYEKRFRRILPALYVVIAATVLAGYFLLLPDEYKNVGQSVFATVTYVNNILLYITSGYWDLASQFKPLLHTWSLGIEEQYYAIVPILLLTLWKFTRRYILHFICACIACSLFFQIWATIKSPALGFYSLPARFWELGAGALCAILLFKKMVNTTNIRANNVFSVVGIVLIVGSVVLFDNDSLSASKCSILLIPIVGSCLIVLFSNSTIVCKILSNKHIVYIGLISYSLYLWHQPVFVFIRAYFKEEPYCIVVDCLAIGTHFLEIYRNSV